MSAATTTPLLLLLDGVLSQDETRTREAVSLISEKLRELHQVLPTTGCPLNSRPALHAIVYALLSACPDDISVRSSHDNSLPLHFAASLGDIHVANMILMQVSVKKMSETSSFRKWIEADDNRLIFWLIESTIPFLIFDCSSSLSESTSCWCSERQGQDPLALRRPRRSDRDGSILYARSSSYSSHCQ